MNLKSKILSILFAAGRPIKTVELAKSLKNEDARIKEILSEIQKDFSESGIRLIEQKDKYQLVTAPEAAQTVTDFLNAEIREHLTDAAIETLAIIAYKQPITRAEIESIRGVNSQYIIRQLSIRGLIERTTSADDARKNVYQTTLEFLKHMGTTDRSQLPDFDEMTKAVSLQEEQVEKPQDGKPAEDKEKDNKESDEDERGGNQ